MDWGGPAFVLIIIAMGMATGVLKSWGRPRGSDNRDGAREIAALAEENVRLRAENVQAREEVKTHEERLITLERIVTDKSYDLSNQIEALRDTKDKVT